jgi:alkanesulfonate monooxygenase SsuD/methylene tetrahydromethanopterin reductase-like flavin-dependent oxidoreductase (luciferase family)
MHLGVFVLGAGNHSAGWRWEGAAVSNNNLAVIQEIARIAERGKFDLLFVSDGLDYEQGDLPSFMCRFEPTSLISVLRARPEIIESTFDRVRYGFTTDFPYHILWW